MPGAESKLTPETAKRICDAISAGNAISVAALSAGVSPTSAYHWIRLADPSYPGPRGRRKYKEFARDVEMAQARAEAHAVITVRKAIQDGEWRAAIEWLKRARPERWSEHTQHHHEGTVQILRKATEEELVAFAGPEPIDVTAEEIVLEAGNDG